MANRLSSKEPTSFIGYVQLHERLWGMDTYPDRPTLEEILSAPVVVLWYPAEVDEKAKKDPYSQERYTITLHDDLRAVETYINRLIFRMQVQTPRHRLSKVFKDSKQVKVKSVAITFEESE